MMKSAGQGLQIHENACSIRREFRRPTNPNELLDDRIDYGFNVLRWMNQGNEYAETIFESLTPRQKPAESKFSIGDVLTHKKEERWKGTARRADACQSEE